MQMQLYKKLVVLNEGKQDEKKFYSFYLKLENGSEIQVKPNSYKDKKGNQN